MADRDKLRNVSIFDDLSQPRANYLRLMKNDERIKLVWTREVCIHFTWKADEKLYRVNDQHDGRKFLNYSATSVLIVSAKVFSGNQVDPEAHAPFPAITKNHSNSVINIMLTNFRSLKKHHEDLEALVYNLESPPKILCITETWLSKNDNKDMFVIKGFHSVYSEVGGSRGGGTML